MESGIKSVASRKQLLAATVAAGLLVAIFVPFQRAEAASVNYEADGAALAGQTIPKSGPGKEIVIEITLAPGESLDKDLPVTLAPGLPNPANQSGIIDLKAEKFTANPSTGTPDSLFKNISVDLDTTPYGYAYSYGYATTDGFVGPVTITITLTLKTSFLHQGPPSTSTEQTLTLDVNGTDFPVNFFVSGNAAVATESVTGAGPKTITTGSGKIITINPGGGSGTVTVAHQTLSSLSSLFGSVGTNTATLSLGSSTLQTIGDLFEIDAEGLMFPVDITISYDPNLLPSGVREQDVRFLHFDEDTGEWEDVTLSRNPGQNTVTGRLFSLSPVVAGADPDDAVAPSGGGGGGGGGGSRGPVVQTWPKAQTFPESYFFENPLARILVSNSAFFNAAGLTIAEANVNQQVSVSGSFTNQQEADQNYAFIVAVTNAEGFTTEINWQESIIGSGSTAEISVLWTPEEAGIYDVKIFVWNGISLTPEPLSEVTVKRISVS